MSSGPAQAGSIPVRLRYQAVDLSTSHSRSAALERNPRLGLFLRLAVVLGARRGELCALRWRHVDLDRGEVLLERGVVYVSRQPLIDKPTKTRSKRRLALDAGTVELLRTHRARGGSLPVVRP